MKKIPIFIIISIFIIGVFAMGFSKSSQVEPNTYYQVYLNAEKIGVIKSKNKLENYINKQGDSIKKELKVDTVYAPTGLEIKEVSTYKEELKKVEDVYEEIAKKSNFAIKGYQFTLKRENKETKETNVSKIYVTKKEDFEKAIKEVIKIYVGSDKYQAYIEDNQIKVKTIGRETRNIYLEESITIKETLIEVSNKIYTNSESLSQYLLFGENQEKRKYNIKVGETIEEVAYNNKISVNEFLLSNPSLNNKSTLVYAGQEVTIGIPDPKVNVVLEEYVVNDQEVKFNVQEVFDSKMMSGSQVVMQQGSNGKIRVAQNVKTINGQVNYVENISTEQLQPAVNKIIKLGTRVIKTVGTGNWRWPTDPGWTISSPFGWRIDPFSGRRSFHGAIDITGNYNTKLYAVDNGTVYEVSYTGINGYYVIINHNNGYYTYYGHMIRKSDFLTVGQSIEKGQVIGHIGSTGAATGPHVHFSVWVGIPWRGYQINPMNMY